MPITPFLHTFLLTLLAGLATGVGSIIALVSKRTSPRFLSLSLGFSAEVMIFVSLVELFVEARSQLALVWGPKWGPKAAIGELSAASLGAWRSSRPSIASFRPQSTLMKPSPAKPRPTRRRIPMPVTTRAPQVDIGGGS